MEIWVQMFSFDSNLTKYGINAVVHKIIYRLSLTLSTLGSILVITAFFCVNSPQHGCPVFVTVALSRLIRSSECSGFPVIHQMVSSTAYKDGSKVRRALFIFKILKVLCVTLFSLDHLWDVSRLEWTLCYTCSHLEFIYFFKST